MSDSSDLPMQRRDQELDFHDVVQAACPHCGCQYVYAADDPEMRWDPGPAWEEDCTDKACHCHADPIVGRRPDQEAVNPL